MKPVIFSRHSLEQMSDRGATKEEVEASVGYGEQVPAKKGRLAFRKNFPFRSTWKGHYYETRQVLPIVVE